MNLFEKIWKVWFKPNTKHRRSIHYTEVRKMGLAYFTVIKKGKIVIDSRKGEATKFKLEHQPGKDAVLMFMLHELDEDVFFSFSGVPPKKYLVEQNKTGDWINRSMIIDGDDLKEGENWIEFPLESDGGSYSIKDVILLYSSEDK